MFVLINSILLNLSCPWVLFQKASSILVSDFESQSKQKQTKMAKHEDKSVTFVTWMERRGWVTSMSAGEDQQASCKFFSTHQ